jgi:hypothetical protein
LCSLFGLSSVFTFIAFRERDFSVLGKAVGEGGKFVLKFLALLPGCEIEYFSRILPVSQKL